MSTRRKSASSTSMRNARKSGSKMPKTLEKREGSSRMFKPVVLESLPSSSPLASRYDTTEFKLALDNDISAHVAEHALHLRRLREYSQLTVATGMGTSQSKVARIEGGDENITLSTLKKLATALGGRIRFALEPTECHFPTTPNSGTNQGP